MAFAQAMVLRESLKKRPCKFGKTNLFPNAGESTSFATFVYWVDDPANPGITTNLKDKYLGEITRIEY